MGKTFSTGLLTNGIWQDASNNIGIGAANSSFKFQVTGTTNLTGALSGTSGTFSGLVSGGNSSPSTSYNAGSWFTGDGLVAGNISSVCGIQINSSTTSTLSAIRFGDGDGANNLYDQGFIIYRHTTDAMLFGTNRSTVLTLASTGAATFSSPSSIIANGQGIRVYSTDSQAADLGGGISFGGYYVGTSTTADFANIKSGKDNSTSGNYAGYLAFSTNAQATGNVERMRITSGGIAVVGYTAGVGTIFSPPIQVKGGAGAGNGFGIISANNEMTGGMQLASSGSNSINIIADPDNLRGSSEIGFLIDGSQRMVITSGGDVGIGNTAFSSTRLTTTGSSNTSSHYSIVANNASNANLFWVRCDGLINTGLSAASPYNQATTGRSMVIESTGSLGYTSSTRESKTNIEQLSDVSWLYQLNPVSFNYRKKDDEMNYTDEFNEEKWYGLIADEVESINEDLVFYNTKEDGTKQLAGVEYNKIIAALIKSSQEQQAQIEELKALINK